jgi:SanA protein
VLLMTLLQAAARFFGLVVLAAAGGVAGCVWLVQRAARGRVFNDPRRVAARGPGEVALVLGTSKVTRRGWPNAHFSRRLDAAAALYHAGGVRRLIVSGSAHNSRNENEPADMRAGLRARGVPDGAITEDPAGFRTLDSVVRAREIFGQRRLTIVTDGFHAPRAVFLARRRAGIDAIALASAPVRWRRSRKTRLRELGAVVRACVDTFILRTRPRA